MISWPATHVSLREAGWTFLEQTQCRACRRTIQFWRTPAGKACPMVVDADLRLTSHFADCPAAKQFRKKGVEKK